ncbi:MAG: phosphatase domain-containing protein [Tunicatimonas sp.]
MDSLLALLDRIEDSFDRTKFAIRKKLDLIKPVMIVPYRGYGNRQAVSITGRVLEDTGIVKPTPDDTVWQNLVASAKRIGSREIPFVRVQGHFQGKEETVETDEEGYFNLTFAVDDTLLSTNTAWYPVQLRLLDEVVEGQEDVIAQGEVLIPSPQAEFGVISDIDDTVLVSDVGRLLQMFRRAFMENATARHPFPGVTAFYHALQVGVQKEVKNPLFFVSSSPWNLYDLLIEFFNLQDIPKAPVLLRDLGISDTMFIKEGHGTHKLGNIRRILETYPSLNFVLVGDSSQHDPEIYRQVVEEFPGRILAIYIRDVTPDHRDVEIVKIGDALREHQVDLMYCEHTEDAARHAITLQLLSPDQLPEIHREKEQDEQA